MSDKKAEALKLVEEALFQLESPKGTVTAGVQKLSRAASLLNEKNIHIWAEIQLGNSMYIYPIERLIEKILEEYEETKTPVDISKKSYAKLIQGIQDIGIDTAFTLTNSFLGLKSNKAAGGLKYSISTIEDHLPYLKKNGNDKELYLKQVQHHIDYIKKNSHQYLTELYEKLKFTGTVSSSFDLLKNVVDDKLLDLNPELAEQLMLAFKSISADSKEEWSQALTTCRRLLEGLADQLFPATDAQHNGRPLKQNHYINRLWAFMDQSIESASNKDLAKAHIDFLGSWLQKSYALTNKGVHAEVSQLEATRYVSTAW